MRPDSFSLPVYSPDALTVPQPVPWYLNLLYLLTALSSRIHFNVEYFKIYDANSDVERLMNSFMMSGGLLKERSASGRSET